MNTTGPVKSQSGKVDGVALSARSGDSIWVALIRVFNMMLGAAIIFILILSVMMSGTVVWCLNNRAKEVEVVSGQHRGRIVKAEICCDEEPLDDWVPLSAGTVRRLNAAVVVPRPLETTLTGHKSLALRLVFADGYTVDLPAYFSYSALWLFANNPIGVFTAPRRRSYVCAGRMELRPLSPSQARIVQKVQGETAGPIF